MLEYRTKPKSFNSGKRLLKISSTRYFKLVIYDLLSIRLLLTLSYGRLVFIDTCFQLAEWFILRKAPLIKGVHKMFQI